MTATDPFNLPDALEAIRDELISGTDLDPFWAGTTPADHHEQASRRWTQLPANVTRDGDNDATD